MWYSDWTFIPSHSSSDEPSKLHQKHVLRGIEKALFLNRSRRTVRTDKLCSADYTDTTLPSL